MERAASLLDVAQHFFSAAITPADWAPALDATVGLLRAEHAIIVVHEPATGRAVLTKSAGMDDAHFARYLSPEAATWMAPFIKAMPGGTVVRVPPQLMPDRHFARTELYNEVVRPANGFYAVALRHELPALSVFMAACRPRSAGNFEANDAAALQALQPHLATSLQLHHRLQATQERHEAVTTVLDRLADGVILTDAAARPTSSTRERRKSSARPMGWRWRPSRSRRQHRPQPTACAQPLRSWLRTPRTRAFVCTSIVHRAGRRCC